MGEQITDTCNKCGKVVVKSGSASSSDMVRVTNLSLIYLSDVYPPDKLSRASLELSGHRYCPSCLVDIIAEWVDSLKLMAPSDIHVYKEISKKQ